MIFCYTPIAWIKTVFVCCQWWWNWGDTARVWYEQNMIGLFWGDKEYVHIGLKEGGYLGDLGLDVIIVLKSMLKKIWTGIGLVQN